MLQHVKDNVKGNVPLSNRKKNPLLANLKFLREKGTVVVAQLAERSLPALEASLNDSVTRC